MMNVVVFVEASGAELAGEQADELDAHQAGPDRSLVVIELGDRTDQVVPRSDSGR
jgi:hypothetical protein